MSQLTILVDPAEFATILAALRYYQQEGQGEPSNRSDGIHVIATDGDTHTSLDAAGIDALCERINQGTPVRCVIGLEGGLVTGVTANVILEFTVLDYDVEGCDDDEVMTVPSLGEEGKVVDVFKRGFWDADVAPGMVDRLHAAIEQILDEEE
jgi:ribonuclease PH